MLNKRTLLSATFTCLALISIARAGAPVDDFKAKFSAQEQILLAGVLTDPAQAAEFEKDAAAGGTATTKWYGRISAFSADYLSRQHTFNDSAALAKNAQGKAAGVRYMAEAAEWKMLMDALDKMSRGGAGDKIQYSAFVVMLNNANKDLNDGDTEAGHSVVNTGRKKLVDALNEYLGSPNGKAGIAENARQKQNPAAVTPPAVVNPPVAVKPPAKKPEHAAEEKVEPTPAGGETDDQRAQKAREQAEKIRQELANGGNGNQGFEGDKSNGGGGTTVVAGSGGSASNQTGLTPAGGGVPNLTVKEPPAPAADDDDMAKLNAGQKKIAGHKTLYATIGGGLLGGILGALVGFFLGGPLGAIIGGAIGAAGGAYGGHKLGKKLWG